MNVLIVSLKGDPHALSAALTLQLRGHHVVVWAGPAAVGSNLASVSISAHDFGWIIDGKHYTSDFFDLIWWRRTPGHVLPEYLHEDDHSFAKGENTDFFRGLWSVAAPTTRWLHSPEVSARAENKFVQLNCASQVGLMFPETLISNDCAEIFGFIDKMHAESHKVIYKTFGPAGWKHGDGLKIKYTNTVDRAALSNERMVRAVPGIYQKRLTKAFEVRSTFFGDTEASVKIDSQRHALGVEDWRATVSASGMLSPTELPRAIYLACLEIMRKLNIRLACFDFVVDPDGNYHFLELNQQGQFLWVEEALPSMPMLELFVDFVEEEYGNGRTRSEEGFGTGFETISQSDLFSKAAARLSVNGVLDFGGFVS